MNTVEHSEGAQRRRLGIMGGGQLGMLLCQAARPLGIETAVLEPNPAGSALGEADTPIVASLGDTEAVRRLIAASDVVTFELEAIPDESLDLLREAEAAGRITVHPSIDTLMRFKDKGVQKAWLESEGLPTLPHLPLHDGQAPVELADGRWSLPVVQKAHRGGYDGKGVQLLRRADDLDRLWDVPSYLEPALDPVRELSVVVCRDRTGALAHYPPVSMTFDDRYNAVHSVTSPAEASPELISEARRIALDAISRLDTPGVFAVELFVDSTDHVTINEISPRVHNSGHLTLEAFDHSQFEQHVRAVMGLPLAPIEAAAPASEMLNILYDDRFESACPPAPRVDELPGDVTCRVYWYGKSTGQAGRKMGHITAAGDDAARVRATAEDALAGLGHADGATRDPHGPGEPHPETDKPSTETTSP
jgi:5-(carboxyamino)imidazole ribonucleotide synthase